MEQQMVIETTLGDLVVALTEETKRYVRDETDAYKVVAFALVHLLYNRGETPKEWLLWQ